MTKSVAMTEADYDAALREIEVYFDVEPELGSAEAGRFEELSALISAYEAEHWKVGEPVPGEVAAWIVARREQPSDGWIIEPVAIRNRLGMTQQELAAMLRLPLGTIIAWEREGACVRGATRSLLRILDRETEAVMRAMSVLLRRT